MVRRLSRIILSALMFTTSVSLLLESGALAQQTAPLGRLWSNAESVPVSGQDDPKLRPLDQLMVSFLAEHQIPGATLAVTKQGRLVYARGFGYRDLENKQVMQPETRMRLASVSKPITGVAVMQLADRGKLKLTDKAFSNLPFKTRDGNGPIDPRVNEITIQHLLRHRGGFDRDVSFDPMFRERTVAKYIGRTIPVEPRDIIQFMLTQKLDFNPGERYAYSNFGYSVLGRVIEQVSGMNYETYVEENVLKPLGIQNMKIGKTRFNEIGDDETYYYTRHGKTTPSLMDQDKIRVQYPYGRWSVKCMDAHGGWTASAVDLVTFASAFDNPKNCPILSENAVQAMFVPPNLERLEPGKTGIFRYYSHGWSVVMFPDRKRLNSYHSGLFSGTSTILVRRHDGFNWAVLFNTNKTLKGKTPSSEIDSAVHRAVNSVKNWPR